MIEIQYNLDKKIREIEIDINNDNFQTRETEDFCLRLLNKVYPSYHFKNLGYDKTNTEAIDLIDEIKGELGIQITAQKSKENKKISDTVSKTVKYWKEKGVKVVWILFITETDKIKQIDTIKEYCNQDGISVYIKTFRRIIGDINEKTKDEIFQIDEFIRQDVNPDFIGLSKLSNFKLIDRNESLINDSFFNIESEIYFNKNELRTIDWISRNYNEGKLKEFFILGNPCSGKTTFAYSIKQKISNRKVFYIDLSAPLLIARELFEELTQISFYYSVVVIDNIHENVDLFEKIRTKLANFKIVESLFLSRYYKTIDYLNDESIYKIIDNTSYYRIDKKEDFDDKVSGIIWKKTKKLIEVNNKIIWRKGNFNKILVNTNKNLLKLNIALKIWEQTNKELEPISFDQIDSVKILDYFFKKQELGNLKSDALYTYSFLYKCDIPFVLLRDTFNDNLILQEKGIILQFYKSDFFYFPHKDYAQLIFDSYDFIEYGISIQKKAELVINYLHKFDTKENELKIFTLLTKFHFSDEKEIIDYLVADEKIETLIISEISNPEINFNQVLKTLEILYLHSANLDSKILKEYFLSFISLFKVNKLSLYIESHYQAYSRLIQISDIIEEEINKNSICVNLKINEKSTSNSIVELTLRINKKHRESGTILRILNSFDFPDWLQMFNDLPKLSSLTNSLQELNSTIESKHLLLGLMKNIDWDINYNKAKSLKIDQFAKSLNELRIIDISLGTNVSRRLFQKAYSDFFFKEKFAKANLSEYSKAYSDLSKLNLAFVKSELKKDLESNLIFEKFSNEKKISNFTMRVQELSKLFDCKKYFISTIETITESENFHQIIKKEKNLNHILIFIELAKKFPNYKKSKLKSVLTESKAIALNIPNKIDLLNNPKILNLNNLDQSFIESLSSTDIENYFKQKKITYSEDLFRVLSSIDKKKTIAIFKEVDNQIIINALLNPELNFSQSIETLYKLKNKIFINEELNCDKKITEILNKYLQSYTKDKRRYNRLSISNYLKGFYFCSKIDLTTTNIYCFKDFQTKLQSDNHKGFELAPLFQFVRRISELYNGLYDELISKFLEINTHNFIENIRKENITKTLSGFSELALTNFDIYADELLFNARNIIISKVNPRRNEEIYKVKLIPDLEKIAKNKAKVILKELRK